MPEETEVETKDVGTEIVVREHGDTMSFEEFSAWMSENFGGSSIGKVLQNAAFMLCCDVIAQDISKAPLQLRERLGNGTSRVVAAEQHPLAEMVALEPNRFHTWREFTEMMVYWGCLSSNSYAGIVRNRHGDPLELIPFQSGRVQMKVEGRDIFYQVTAGTQFEMAMLGAGFRTLPERDFVHVRYRNLDGQLGYSTLSAGRKTLDTSANIEEFRNNLFGDEGQIRGIFSASDALPSGPDGELAFQRLRQQYKHMMTKFAAAAEPIVLEYGMKFDPIASKPSDLELVKQFAAQINEVCRLLRVPPHKVFALEGVKYENLETMDKAYLSETLEPRAQALEERMSRMLLSKKDRTRFFFQYDRSKMAIKDAKNETERAVRALERGGINFDEFRAILGFNPLDNGQGKHRLIPTNMTVIDENGNVLIGGQNLPKDNDEAEAEIEAEEETQKAVLRLVRN